MNYKIVFHYAIYFFIAALFLIVINIIYMQNTVYQNEELYHFDPNTYFSEIESKLELNANKEITAPSKLKDFLEDKRISIQILNTNYEEKYRLINDIKILKKKYTPENLINLYQSDKVTSFIKDIEINGKTYSLLMFLNPENVKRRLYTYDVDLVETAYNPLWLVIMNLILLIIISYIYSYRISRPMNNII